MLSSGTPHFARAKFFYRNASCPKWSLQIFEELGDSAKRYYDYEEWERPGGAQVQLNQGDATILLPNETALPAQRTFGRAVWFREAPDHINPGSPGAGAGRLYQSVAKVSRIP